MRKFVERETGRALGKDERGIEHEVIEYTTFAVGLGAGEPLPLGAGLTRFATSQGVHLDRIGKGYYRIARLGLAIVSDAEDAP